VHICGILSAKGINIASAWYMHTALGVVSMLNRSIYQNILPYAHFWQHMLPTLRGSRSSMLGSHLSSGRYEKHTTKTIIVLAACKIYNNAILSMFSTS
jgi:uncharacterized membrane protein